MKLYRDTAIVVSMLAIALFFNANLYHYLHHYYNYLILMSVLIALLFVLKKMIGFQYAWVGAVVLVGVVIYGILDSPYRLSKLQAFVSFFGA